MLNGKLTLDYNALMADQIGPEHGLTQADLEALLPQLETVHQQISSRSGAGKDFLGFLDLPFQDEAELAAVQACADKLAAESDLHVVLGIGGSYLGARALFSALCHPYHNERSRSARGQRPRLYFEGNNMDSDALKGLLDLLPTNTPADLSERWSLNVISKSGGTLETAVSFRLLRQLAEAHYGPAANQKIVATTDASKGTLKALADREGYSSFEIPDNVGGRYSIFTPVGLLPAAVVGIDIQQLMQGARDMATLCQQPGLANPAYLYAALQYLSTQRGKVISVMNIWDKALEYVGFWYDQLAAESLGKDGQGRVPLTGVCSRDLHARGQQLQEGARNTLITNLFVAQSDHSLSIQDDPANSDGLNYLNGKNVHDLLHKAFEGTHFAYTRDQRPGIHLILQERSPYCLGALFYLLEVATLAEGYLNGINPLDQPGVESYKNFMFGLLGREDKKAYRDEFEQRPQPQAAYQL